MKKLFIVLAVTLMVTGVVSAQIKKGDTAWIASKTAAIKTSTWFFAGTRGTLQLGDRVTVLQVSGNWAEVRSVANTSLSGWTQLVNLSSRQISTAASGASANEVALAGKGFNQEVEDTYKTSGNYNYDDVDKVEAITVSQDDLYKFMVDGHLFTGE
ncbi:MAG: hypothetical protein FWH35_02510 [Treponema sp.]|nr:hypothetical protein [Treponema sp.]